MTKRKPLKKKQRNKKAGKLTPKQRAFALAYVATKDVRLAYHQAGYKGKNGNEEYANKIFELPQVKREIDRLLLDEGVDSVGDELTEKQKTFAREFLLSNSKLRAARKAGYCEKGLQQRAYELANNPAIIAYMNEIRKERAKRLTLSTDYVVERLQEIVERCMGHKPVLPDAALKEINKVRPANRQMSPRYTFSAYNAIQALELLGKHMAMFTDNLNFKGEITQHTTGVLYAPKPISSLAEWEKMAEEHMKHIGSGTAGELAEEEKKQIEGPPDDAENGEVVDVRPK